MPPWPLCTITQPAIVANISLECLNVCRGRFVWLVVYDVHDICCVCVCVLSIFMSLLCLATALLEHRGGCSGVYVLHAVWALIIIGLCANWCPHNGLYPVLSCMSAYTLHVSCFVPHARWERTLTV